MQLAHGQPMVFGRMGNLTSITVAFIVAQILKACIDYNPKEGLKFTVSADKGVDWERAFRSGGMPSSHSALASSLTTSIGRQSGVTSEAFAIALVFTLIVLYDACHVRWEAGLHAQRINRIISTTKGTGSDVELGLNLTEEPLKEVIGHTPTEVAGGTALGIICGLLFT